MSTPRLATAPSPPPGAPHIWARALRAESTKLLTLRFSVIAPVAMVLTTWASSWAITALVHAAQSAGRPEDAGGLDAGSAFLVILHYGQVGVVVLAAWTMHQESDAGSLRTTLLAMPARSDVLLAKGALLAVVAAATGVLCAAGAAGARCLVIQCGSPVGMFAPSGRDELRILLGVILYWTLLALFTHALAVLFRSGLAAMGIVLALALAVSVYLQRITPLARYLPDQAGAQLYQAPPVASGDLGPLLGGLVLLAWTVLALVAAVVIFRRQSIGA